MLSVWFLQPTPTINTVHTMVRIKIALSELLQEKYEIENNTTDLASQQTLKLKDDSDLLLIPELKLKIRMISVIKI